MEEEIFQKLKSFEVKFRKIELSFQKISCVKVLKNELDKFYFHCIQKYRTPIPDEIMLIVFSFVDVETIYRKLLTISKRFYNLLTSEIGTLVVLRSKFPRLRKFKYMKNGKLKCLKLNESWDKSINKGSFGSIGEKFILDISWIDFFREIKNYKVFCERDRKKYNYIYHISKEDKLLPRIEEKDIDSFFGDGDCEMTEHEKCLMDVLYVLGEKMVCNGVTLCGRHGRILTSEGFLMDWKMIIMKEEDPNGFVCQLLFTTSTGGTSSLDMRDVDLSNKGNSNVLKKLKQDLVILGNRFFGGVKPFHLFRFIMLRMTYSGYYKFDSNYLNYFSEEFEKLWEK